jgi:hypothetical protein
MIPLFDLFHCNILLHSDTVSDCLNCFCSISLAFHFASVMEDEPSAISVAMTTLGLQPGVAFEAKVAQLAQLVAAHQTVCLLNFLGEKVRPQCQFNGTQEPIEGYH